MLPFFFFEDTAPPDISTLSLHDALPILVPPSGSPAQSSTRSAPPRSAFLADSTERSEEHTSELQSRENLVCRLLLEKKNKMLLLMSEVSLLHAEFVAVNRKPGGRYLLSV